ncbi:ABC transporter permease [Planotetraspora sp. A-T 1434]|uniref:ABC transporter permease n=1 Tax=Planotetraspora sp. A-T 1434 TaxID=2979219 RepID=UPI0021C0D57B|nr:ABC transporter permease [Planotetraspora sp. A-T 1434]MCT9934177.1 ABC transporter permease [Planotetraspora sp. A-T 1434]
MRNYLLSRVGQIALTLLVVSLLVFVLCQVLPGNLAQTILGPHATADQVAILNHKLGADQPLWTRFFSWLKGFVTGDWGQSQLLQEPVFGLIMGRLGDSLLLAAVAFVTIVPISVIAGIAAGLKEAGPLDRFVSIGGVSLTVIPEFVSGVVLLSIFAIGLHWLPVTAVAPPGSSFGVRLEYLILPAIPLAFVLFGYIARMARAGTIDVLAQPYYRTAILKGLPRRRIVVSHVTRNALPPTVAVIAGQVTYLVGGLIVVEALFNYPGIGKLLLDSATGHDITVVQAATLTLGLIIMLANLLADVLFAVLVPRIRLGGSR